MNNLIRFTKITFLLGTLFTAISCVDDDDNGNIIDNIEVTTIADFLANNEDYSSLQAALVQTGIDTALAGSGTFTVFAPDNAAFDAFLGGAALADVDNDLLTQLLLNHVLNITVSSDQFPTGYLKNLATESSTSANLDVYIDTSAGVVINGQSTVVLPDIVADNGIVHGVDTVIDLPTIVTFATSNPNLSSLEAALTDEGNMTFTTLLSDTNQDFTVFAPTNDAFSTFLDGATLDDVDNDVLAQVLSNHLVRGATALSTSLSNSYVNTSATFNGEIDRPLSLYVNTDSGVTLNGISNVVIADIVASNGVVHVVDAVIGLPDITTFATADPTFNTLVSALTADMSFGFVADLQTPNGTPPAPFTVFAPTNGAFTALLDDLNVTELSEIPIDVLADTLELHVITETNIRGEELPGLDNTMVSTLGGANITIQADPLSVIDPDDGVNPIIATDVQAANGVIHVVSRVLRDL